jgi:phenylacetate-coenzyme A ligase PaaK-like adenylate-forming protein
MTALSVDEQVHQPLEDFSACLQHERWTHQQVGDDRAQALRACRDYAYAHSPFYQRFHRGLQDRPLQELPVLTKAMMMEHFDELVTDPAIRLRDVQAYLARADATVSFLDRYHVVATSGSTGQPGIFLSDRAEDAIDGNSFIRCQYWGGVTPKSRAAIVTVVTSMTQLPPVAIDEQPVSLVHLSATDPLKTLVQRLNDWQPDVLIGYSSITAVLADEQLQGRLHIAPRTIFCAGDTLTSGMRRRIEAIWQTRLFSTYATTEGSVMASECSFHQGMHLFEDFSIVEVVDQDNRPVPPGVQGDKVLLTVLFRRTQPLIRYEVSDLVRPSIIERCPCGRPFALIDAVQGRMIEVLSIPSHTGAEEDISPYLFELVFDTLPVSGWQVVQELDGLHIFLTGAPEQLPDDQVVAALRQMLTKRGVLVPAITIHWVAALSRHASGKTPMVLSHVLRRAA